MPCLPQEIAAKKMAEFRRQLKEEFELDRFLRELNLQDYEDIMMEMGFEEFDHVLTIEEDDLDAIGMMARHKTKLLRAVKALNR